MQDLVSNMLQKDPNSRQMAQDYLDQQRNKAFPGYFYSFLKEYVQGFSFVPILAPDDKITRYNLVLAIFYNIVFLKGYSNN